jgi:hypothetical protein
MDLYFMMALGQLTGNRERKVRIITENETPSSNICRKKSGSCRVATYEWKRIMFSFHKTVLI